VSAPAAGPEDLHEWISFEDPDEHRTWVFDATFLRSDYRCIYGQGCKGILDDPAPELHLGCCSLGAHFVDDADRRRVADAYARLRPGQMQFHATARREGFVVEETGDDGEEVATTRLVEDACIFLNRPEHAGGPGCALHAAALAIGERPLDWKPEVCWQVPLRLEHSEDESGHVTSRLREWKRRDWGDGGEDFGWWCTDTADAFVGDEPVYRWACDEIAELVGVPIYEMLVQVLERPGWVPLEHPAVRGRRPR
jgi:hypothetical protein